MDNKQDEQDEKRVISPEWDFDISFINGKLKINIGDNVMLVIIIVSFFALIT